MDDTGAATPPELAAVGGAASVTRWRVCAGRRARRLRGAADAAAASVAGGIGAAVDVGTMGSLEMQPGDHCGVANDGQGEAS